MDIVQGDMKKGICTLKLEKLKPVYNSDGKIDDSLVSAIFSIIDFDVSGNKQLVSKEVCLNSAWTLKFKPLVCQYFESTDSKEPNDSFGTHGEYIGKLRDGTEYLLSNTHAIGVCDKDGYLGVIKDDKGNDMDALLASFVLWKYRYPNEITLINEFYESNEPLYTSCEYYYATSEVKTDTNNKQYEEITGEILFDGHCCLGSDIPPAYNSSKLISFNSKWNKALNEKKYKDIQNQGSDFYIKNKESEGDLMEGKITKVINELSLGKVATKLYDFLYKTMTAEEFNRIWISDYNIYSDHFIYEYWNGNNYEYFDVNYSINESDEVVVDFEGKTKVEKATEWKAVLNELEEVKKQLNEKIEVLAAKDDEIETLKESVNTITEEKTNLETSLNTKDEELTVANEKIVSLNAIAEKAEKEEFERKLSNALETYKDKFESVNAIERFETEEVQELIKEAITDNKALLSLNNMIVELIPVAKSSNENHSTSKMPIMGKEMNNLISDQPKSVDEKYFN